MEFAVRRFVRSSWGRSQRVVGRSRAPGFSAGRGAINDTRKTTTRRSFKCHSHKLSRAHSTINKSARLRTRRRVPQNLSTQAPPATTTTSTTITSLRDLMMSELGASRRLWLARTATSSSRLGLVGAQALVRPIGRRNGLEHYDRCGCAPELSCFPHCHYAGTALGSHGILQAQDGRLPAVPLLELINLG